MDSANLYISKALFSLIFLFPLPLNCSHHKLFENYVDDKMASKLEDFWNSFNLNYAIKTSDELDTFLNIFKNKDLIEIEKMNAFISELGENIQREIWIESIGEKKMSKEKGDYCPSRFVNYSENYLEFLAKVAKEEHFSWLQEYLGWHRKMGSISPTAMKLIYTLPQTEIKDNEIVKFIVVIHYMTTHYYQLIE